MAIRSILNDLYTTLSEDENFETTTLIWLDSESTKPEDRRQSQKKFRTAVNHTIIFDKTEDYKQYIQNLSKDDRVIFITSGKLGREFVPYIHHFRQITSIYIYCMDTTKNERWTKEYIKIKGVFSSPDELIQNFISDQSRQPSTKIDEPLSINIFTTRNNSDQSTTVLNYKFVYHNLFLNTLLQMTPTSKDKDELISRCKELYKNNPTQLLIINEFKETYTSDRALLWYTRDTFLYRLLNKALRIQNIDLLFFFQFFIYDIKQQIEFNQCIQPMKIYRAQLMSKDEINELNHSIGEYISINSFFSTSCDKEYAIFLFGDNESVHDGLHRVLFEIDADPNHTGIKPFADISLKSFFPSESEVLIMPGAIFRLDSITSNEENIWIINLSLCSDQDFNLKSRIEQITNEFNNNQEIDLFSFGKILHQMNKFDEAAKYYRRLLTQYSDDYKQTGLCYYQLGRVYSGKGNYEDSIKWYIKSLKIMTEIMDADDLNIADCYNSMGNSFRKNESYQDALDVYHKALVIWKQTLGEDHLKIAMCLTNMGVVFDAIENYTEALKCLEKALKIKQKYHGMNHSDVAVLYNNIGLVHEHCDNFDLALENFEQALEIYRNSFDLQNIEYGRTLENIAYLYKDYERWRQALIYLEETATAYRYTLSPKHSKLNQIEEDIAYISSLMSDEYF